MNSFISFFFGQSTKHSFLLFYPPCFFFPTTEYLVTRQGFRIHCFNPKKLVNRERGSTFRDELLAAREDVRERLEQRFELPHGRIGGNREGDRPAAELHLDSDGGRGRIRVAGAPNPTTSPLLHHQLWTCLLHSLEIEQEAFGLAAQLPSPSRCTRFAPPVGLNWA